MVNVSGGAIVEVWMGSLVMIRILFYAEGGVLFVGKVGNENWDDCYCWDWGCLGLSHGGSGGFTWLRSNPAFSGTECTVFDADFSMLGIV
jgi:hypothetical protein